MSSRMMQPQRSTFFWHGLLFLSTSNLLMYPASVLAEYFYPRETSAYDQLIKGQSLPTQMMLMKTELAQLSSEQGTGGVSSPCTKADFESAVDKAASVLRDLNFKNKPHFQEMLRLLKDKKGWSQEIYEKEATRIVKDDEIDKLDGQTADILAQITAMGDEGATAKTPDCALLQTLQMYMNSLIETQTAKWGYIFKKMDAQMGAE